MADRISILTTSSRKKKIFIPVIEEKRPSTNEEVIDPDKLMYIDFDSIGRDIFVVRMSVEQQLSLECRIGQDLFVDKPWKSIQKTVIKQDMKKKNSVFGKHHSILQEYHFPEVLIGFEPFLQDNELLFACFTERGREMVLNRLKKRRMDYLTKVEKSLNLPPSGPWKSFGSEIEIEESKTVNNRALITFEWIGEITSRSVNDPGFQPLPVESNKYGYMSLIPKDEFDVVEKLTSHTGVQAEPGKKNVEIQTASEIPVNAVTQFSPEVEIQVNKGCEPKQMASLAEVLKKNYNLMVDKITYNIEYDLYKDDYEELSKSGEGLTIIPSSTYTPSVSFSDVISIKGKLITDTAWHPNFSGVFAVSYGEDLILEELDLKSDSDDSDYSPKESGPEVKKKYPIDSIKLKKTFDRDKVILNEWLQGIKENNDPHHQPKIDWDLAMNTLAALEKARDIRNYELELAKSDEATVSNQDLLERPETFHYHIYRKKTMEKKKTSRKKNVSKKSARQKKHQSKKKKKKKKIKGIQEGKGGIRLDPELNLTGKNEDSCSQIFNLASQTKPQNIFARTGSTPSHFTNIMQQIPIEDEGLLSIWGPYRRLNLGSTINILTELIHRKYKNEAFKVVGTYPSSPILDFQKLFKSEEPLATPSKSKFKPSSPAIKIVTNQSRLKKYSPKSPTSLRSALSDKITESKFIQKDLFVQVSDDEEEIKNEIANLDEVHTVLIWSFSNDLAAKLRLDSPYEITCLTFCPHNGNLLVGGTTNGQIILWDISGKLDLSENPKSSKNTSTTYHKNMEDLMKWRRDISQVKRITWTAQSSLTESHIGKIVSIQWVHPCLQMTERGNFVSVQEGELSCQFFSTSEDGKILVWDLNSPLKPKELIKGQEKVVKAKYPRPLKLSSGISKFSTYDRRLIPFFAIKCLTGYLPLQITSSVFLQKVFKYEQTQQKNPKIKPKIQDIVSYQFVPTDVKDLAKDFYIGNIQGKVLKGNWEETNEDSATVVNFETLISYHDGPINAIRRNPFIPNLILTTGGHVFALWHFEDKLHPIKWKRYFDTIVTYCSWSSTTPTIFRISRSDGTFETWDLIKQSHEPVSQISASGHTITGFSYPMLPMAEELLGIADHNGALRFYHIPSNESGFSKEEFDQMNQFINKEPSRKKEMQDWLQSWKENHIKMETQQEVDFKENIEIKEKIIDSKKPSAKKCLDLYRQEVYKWYIRRRGGRSVWLDEAERRWYEQEEAFMVQQIVKNKGWDQQAMDKEMEPLILMEKEEIEKNIKIIDKLNQADTIFERAVAALLSEDDVTKKVSNISIRVGDVPFQDVVEAFEEVDLFFGEDYKKYEDEVLSTFENETKLQDVNLTYVLSKYRAIREIFNDERRFRNPKYSWIRKKIKKAITDQGFIYGSKGIRKDWYKIRAYEEHKKNLEDLKKKFGEDYEDNNPIWWEDGMDFKFYFEPDDEEELEESKLVTKKLTQTKKSFIDLRFSLLKEDQTQKKMSLEEDFKEQELDSVMDLGSPSQELLQDSDKSADEEYKDVEPEEGSSLEASREEIESVEGDNEKETRRRTLPGKDKDIKDSKVEIQKKESIAVTGKVTTETQREKEMVSFHSLATPSSVTTQSVDSETTSTGSLDPMEIEYYEGEAPHHVLPIYRKKPSILESDEELDEPTLESEEENLSVEEKEVEEGEGEPAKVEEEKPMEKEEVITETKQEEEEKDDAAEGEVEIWEDEFLEDDELDEDSDEID